jgi:hypothetical protein
MSERMEARFTLPVTVRLQVGRAISRGLYPQTLNAALIAAALVVLIGAEIASFPWLLPRLRSLAGGGMAPTIALALVPFLIGYGVFYLVWRHYWQRIVQARIAQREPEDLEIAFSSDDAGLRWRVADREEVWLSWRGIDRVRLIQNNLVFVAGLAGWIVPVAALGPEWREWLAEAMLRVTPEARAASQKEMSDAPAVASPRGADA